jgi:threonylcarbamoyladenosine tRNA methylthiotransferase MtaB
MSVDLVTFGCRLNAYESEVVRTHALAAGLADTIVVNTCAVTAEATRQAKQAIRRLKRERPHARIVVTGCAAQVEPVRFADMPEVDRVLGNVEKLAASSWADTRALFARHPGQTPAPDAKAAVDDIMAVTQMAVHPIDGYEGRARAVVQVQNGCDHRCTFCIIPFGRGNSRSIPMHETVDQVRRLVARGYREVVLTGVDLTSYGAGLPGAPRLGTLVKQILRQVPELARLRLSSIDSVEADPDLLDALGSEPRMMPYLHLSLQAGDDVILKRMKRRHLRADAIALDLVDECGLTHLHVFPFSARPGTPAARMPAVAPAIITERARALRQRGEAALRRHLDSEVGTRRRVLAEAGGGGRTEPFTKVRLPTPLAPGTIVDLAIVGHDGRQLLAAV